MIPQETLAGARGESRAAFFTRIRTALGRDGSSVPPPDSGPADPELDVSRVIAHRHNEHESIVREFVRRAQSVGMQTRACAREEVGAAAAEILRAAGTRTCAIDVPAAERFPGLADDARRAGIEVVGWVGSGPKAVGFGPFFACDAGIALADCAVAESGTLVVRSGAGRPRAITLAPPVSVIIVEASEIVPDLLDLFAAGEASADPREANPPASMVLISGPSKTADIEGVLITGVHGPREVHVIVVTGEA